MFASPVPHRSDEASRLAVALREEVIKARGILLIASLQGDEGVGKVNKRQSEGKLLQTTRKGDTGQHLHLLGPLAEPRPRAEVLILAAFCSFHHAHPTLTRV